MPTNSLDSPVIFHREASFTASSWNSSRRTIDVIWTTGATVRRKQYGLHDGDEYDEELVVSGNAVRLDRLNSGAPFLDSHRAHNAGSVLGAIVPGTARIEGGKGVATVKLSAAKEDAAVVEKIKDGIIRNVSCGYIVHRKEIIPRNGQVPLHRAVDWEPLELSAVAIASDSGAQVRSGVAMFPLTVRHVQELEDMTAWAARMRMKCRSTLADLAVMRRQVEELEARQRAQLSVLEPDQRFSAD